MDKFFTYRISLLLGFVCLILGLGIIYFKISPLLDHFLDNFLDNFWEIIAWSVGLVWSLFIAMGFFLHWFSSKELLQIPEKDKQNE